MSGLSYKQKLKLLLDPDEMPALAPPPNPDGEHDNSKPARVVADTGEHDPDDRYDHGMHQDKLDKWLAESDNDSDYPEAAYQSSTLTSKDFASMTGNDKLTGRPPVGALASKGESFVPIVALSKLPYKWVRNQSLGQDIASAFFDQGKFWRFHWEICYAWPPHGSTWAEPLFMVSRYQVERFIDGINKGVKGGCPSIIAIDASYGVILTFDGDHPSLRPRFLGYSTSDDEFRRLQRTAPSASYRPATESRDVKPATQEAKAAYISKLEQGYDMAKGKKKSKVVRQHRSYQIHQDWRSDLRQAERFLGLRPPPFNDEPKVDEPWSVTVARDAAREACNNPPPVACTSIPPYVPECKPVLIAIDVESYERDNRKITEIGISTLDTMDILGLAPNAYAESWRPAIRSRHFRIKEHMHLQNGTFVAGAAGDFRFGTSEIIDLADTPAIIATCFRPPFSAPTTNDSYTQEQIPQTKPRTIVLVGHDIGNDTRYLRQLGYDVKNLGTLHKRTPMLDTQGIWKVMSGERDPAKLAKLLERIDVTPWGLHNAGNDARYTMEALMGLVVVNVGEREGQVGAGVGEVAEDMGGVRLA